VSLCLHCEQPIAGQPSYETDEGHEVHEACRDNYESNVNEAAYESWLAAYWGGDASDAKQDYEAAWKQKREMER
jgi:hypothetical protein